MRAYIIRRLFLALLTLWFVSLVVFFLTRFIPGNVIDLMIAEMGGEGAVIADVELTIEGIKHALGLDVPVHLQYGRWMGFLPKPDVGFSGVLQGDLGRSLWGGWSIRDELARRAVITIELGLLAILIAWSLALPIGIFSAIRQDTFGDYAGRTTAIVALSIPGFWLATMVTVYPSIWWGWSPSIVYIPLVEDPLGNLAQFLLPAFLMGASMSGGIARYTRTMMLEVLRQDYIRTAWAKGLRERVVVYRHALKNALIPLVTILGNEFATLMGGTVVMETIFNLPGMGRLMVTALRGRDYPVISAINLLVASTIVLINVVVDLSYGYLDPRISYK